MKAALPSYNRSAPYSQALTDGQREIVNAFRSQAYIHNHMDVQPGCQWDSISLKAGEVFRDGLRMFDIPIGANKTYSETSMRAGNRLIAPEAFSIRRVLFTFSKTASEVDIYSIVEGMVWRFFIGSKMYLGSPMISLQQTKLVKAPIRICEYCRSVYVQESNCPGCGSREFQLSNIGGLVAGLVFYMDLAKGAELIIENEADFHVAFSGESYAVRNPLKMWCHFEGLHARGIQ